MGRAHEDYWYYVRRVLYDYPRLAQEERELKTISATPAYGAMGHGAGPGDPTALLATRELPRNKQRRLEAVQQAIRETERRPNGTHRLRVVELVYFKRSHTLQGAALMVPCSYRTAKRWHRDFICQVARNLDLP